MNIAEANRIVWPAEIDGELAPPPGAHVLDYLVRRKFSDTNNYEVSAEFELRPKAATVGVVHKSASAVSGNCALPTMPASAFREPAVVRAEVPAPPSSPAALRRTKTVSTV